MRHFRLISLLLLSACTTPPPVESGPASGPPTLEEAQAWVASVEREQETFGEYVSRVSWVRANFITYDTDWLLQQVKADASKREVRWATEAARFNGLAVPPDLARKLDTLKRALRLPAPSRAGAAEELAAITTRLSTTYATGKIEMDGRTIPLDELEVLMGSERDPARLAEMWTRWHKVAEPMAPDYARMVTLGNEGARELGFANLRELWLSQYDMPPEAMVAEVDRLWAQVEPLYRELHCHVRRKLHEHYGAAVVPLDQPIRADLLGNMWAQQWGNVSALVLPKSAALPYDLTERLVKQGYTPKRMTETAEAFFSSLGFAPLPSTFWERSLLEKPKDREVACHASAWNLDAHDDIRIKMCTKVNDEDFSTVHHELGHNYYQRAYKDLSPILRGGAHDGFHEAIGDFIALSITPEYLARIGLIAEKEMPPPAADQTLLLRMALDKIAFLPFGLLVDKWRWQVFSGEVTPAGYNDAWWALRRKLQGVAPPSARPGVAFDPGAKNHIPGNTPYLRYFLSFIMQFQFHRAACEMAGWKGPLHRCSIYDAKEVGARFLAMLERGAAQPWPKTLALFTGEETMDASALLAYFAPLLEHLRAENAGQTCGWQ